MTTNHNLGNHHFCTIVHLLTVITHALNLIFTICQFSRSYIKGQGKMLDFVQVSDMPTVSTVRMVVSLCNTLIIYMCNVKKYCKHVSKFPKIHNMLFLMKGKN